MSVQPSEPAASTSDRLPTDLFDYDLPPELIAQQPAEPRDASRLLVLHRETGQIEHARFREIGRWLTPGDLLVVNRSRVVPARLAARRRPGGGAAEILLLRRQQPGLWEALVRPGRKLAPGALVDLEDGIVGEIVERTAAGGRLVRFAGPRDDIDAAVLALGRLPLPPYIQGYHGDPERYQTVYADEPGSSAAPTAGLHFTPELLATLRARGIGLATVTLQIGLDTFRPVKADDLREHEIHRETCTVSAETARAIAETRARGGRVVAVGTTSVRSVETVAARPESLAAGWSGETALYILPGYRFRAVDALVTNFHLPRSTLLALVSAFAGRERIMRAYAEAIRERYRFFSFGDAMLIV